MNLPEDSSTSEALLVSKKKRTQLRAEKIRIKKNSWIKEPK
jgi:hypothetical protein